MLLVALGAPQPFGNCASCGWQPGRPGGHPGRDGCDLRIRYLGQQLRYERAAACRRRDGAGESRFFPNAPTIFEAVKLTSDQQWLLDFRGKLEDLGRILLVPPNLPPGRLAPLQGAVKETLN